MSAQDYPVTTPWGFSKDYPLNGGRHKGEDRAMPVGTPVVVNGVQIGLSGNTGYSTGPHLHIGRWVNGVDTNPGGQGFNLPSPLIITSVGYDSENGNYVTLNDANGVRWVYLHLSKQTVPNGLRIGGSVSDLDKVTAIAQHRLDLATGVYAAAGTNGVGQSEEQKTAKTIEVIQTLQNEVANLTAIADHRYSLEEQMFMAAGANAPNQSEEQRTATTVEVVDKLIKGRK